MLYKHIIGGHSAVSAALVGLVILMSPALIPAGVLPDFSADYFMEDIADELYDGDFIRYLREENEDKPPRCRLGLDMCPGEETEDFVKGTFQWPNTAAGYRVQLRCPYAVYNVTYATRDCVLTEGNATWLDDDISACPNPPVEQLLSILAERLEVTLQQAEPLEVPALKQAWNLEALEALWACIDAYTDQVVFPEAIRGLIDVISEAVTYAAMTAKRPLAEDHIKAALRILDHVTSRDRRDSDRRRMQQIGFDFVEKFMASLAVLCEMIPAPEVGHSFRFAGEVITLAVYQTESIRTEDSFEREVLPDEHNFKTTLNTTTVVDTSATDSSGPVVIRMMYIGWHRFIPRYPQLELKLKLLQTFVRIAPTPPLLQPITFQLIPVEPRTQSVLLLAPDAVSLAPDALPPAPDALPPAPDALPPAPDALPPAPDALPPAPHALPQSGSPLTAPSEPGTLALSPLMGSDGLRRRRRRRRREAPVEMSEAFYVDADCWGCNIVGPFLYVTTASAMTSAQENEWQLWQNSLGGTTVTFSIPFEATYLDVQHVACAHINLAEEYGGNISAFSISTWLLNDCIVLGTTDESTLCQCTANGYLAAFAVFQFVEPSIVAPPTTPPVRGLSEFLGFPYSHELYIVSHVLRAVSCVCLVVTVVTYLVYKTVRRGVPTRILINLCISLLGLNLVLYISEAVSGDRKVGCVACNILRYYASLVSLLWNGVEATNMYLMLIKVFGSHVHHFVRKAAAVAWGLPVIPIIVSMAINSKAFNGLYDHKCEFRCQLPDSMLYFGFLIPVCVIVIYNVIIFSVVVKILVNMKKRPGEQSDSGSGMQVGWSRLLGSLSMLVLLGVPWIFSAFSVIDVSNAGAGLLMVEGVFQAVFVIGLNLQGLFIFIFHCARSSDVRQQWRSTFSGSQSTTSTSAKVKSNQRQSVGETPLCTLNPKDRELCHNAPKAKIIAETKANDQTVCKQDTSEAKRGESAAPIGNDKNKESGSAEDRGCPDGGMGGAVRSTSQDAGSSGRTGATRLSGDDSVEEENTTRI